MNYDYFNKLTEDEKEFLKKFNQAYYRCNKTYIYELSPTEEIAESFYKEAVSRKNRKLTSDLWTRQKRVTRIDRVTGAFFDIEEEGVCGKCLRAISNPCKGCAKNGFDLGRHDYTMGDYVGASYPDSDLWMKLEEKPLVYETYLDNFVLPKHPPKLSVSRAYVDFEGHSLHGCYVQILNYRQEDRQFKVEVLEGAKSLVGVVAYLSADKLKGKTE